MAMHPVRVAYDAQKALVAELKRQSSDVLETMAAEQKLKKLEEKLGAIALGIQAERELGELARWATCYLVDGQEASPWRRVPRLDHRLTNS